MPLAIEDYVSGKSTPEIQAFLSEWKLDQQTGGGDDGLDYRLRRWCEDAPDFSIALLLALAERSSSPTETTAIAEGLEWLLEHHGAAYWQILNTLCQTEPSFREIMANVWGASLSKDLKRKVEMWRS